MKRRVVLAVAILVTPFATASANATNVVNISPATVALPIVSSGEVPAFKRIVALGNGAAEIVAALGYKKYLVGRDVASSMPELASVPLDTAGHQVNTEKVLSQKPDIIFIDDNTSPATALKVLKGSNIKMVSIPSAYTLSDVLPKEKAIADALQVPKAYSLLSAKISNYVNPLSKTKVVFLYLRGTSSIYLVGGKGSGADSIFRSAGFTDIGAANFKTPFTDLSAEALVKMQPDVIVLMTKGLQSVGGINGLLKLPGIAQTPAGKKQRIVTIDDSLFLSFGPRTSEMMPKLREAILQVLKK
jgi:iron complex transport system substrate-binding protein